MEKYNLRNGDVVAGTVLAALGTYIVIQASIWPYYSSDGPGPGFFPLWYGILMVGLSLGLIVSTARKPKAEAKKIDTLGLRRAMIVWAAFVVCIALMGYLGFSISFALFTIFVVLFAFRRSLLAAGLTGVLSAIAFYVLFAKILLVQLPTGEVGF
jgi:putative tricarboxylic transport membrane protein